MKEKIKELEAKDAASKESERTQMNQLIQREKELEKLRMDQWREKSAMMEKMKRVKEEHDKKLKEIIDEKNMQNVEMGLPWIEGPCSRALRHVAAEYFALGYFLTKNKVSKL